MMDDYDGYDPAEMVVVLVVVVVVLLVVGALVAVNLGGG